MERLCNVGGREFDNDPFAVAGGGMAIVVLALQDLRDDEPREELLRKEELEEYTCRYRGVDVLIRRELYKQGK